MSEKEMVIELHPLTNNKYEFKFEIIKECYKLKSDKLTMLAGYDKRTLLTHDQPLFKMVGSSDREMYFVTAAIDHNTFKEAAMLYVGLFEGHGINVTDRVFFFQQQNYISNHVAVVRF